VNNLVYAYPKSTQPTVRGISFRIEAGEIFGFLGPSGAGKSTTQKVLIRLLPGYRGDVSVLRKDLRQWGNDYYERIGVGFELPNHYQKLTALENLRFFASFYDKKTQDPLQLLAMVQLQEDAHKKVENFSKGMKMRLNFVRALLHDPDILFLDEPTSGLDPVNARIMKDLIGELKRRGKTIFITTHQMHDADELCDRVAFIVDGEIRLIDSPARLKVQRGQRKVRVEYRNGQSRTAEFDLDGLGRNPAFLALVADAHIESIHSQEATLDEIFIQVTGRRLT
jgi:fluoroquinolone transport system ATP-binding protein